MYFLAYFLGTALAALSSATGFTLAVLVILVPGWKRKLVAAIICGVVAGFLFFQSAQRVSAELNIPAPNLMDEMGFMIAVYICVALISFGVAKAIRVMFHKFSGNNN